MKANGNALIFALIVSVLVLMLFTPLCKAPVQDDAQERGSADVWHDAKRLLSVNDYAQSLAELYHLQNDSMYADSAKILIDSINTIKAEARKLERIKEAESLAELLDNFEGESYYGDIATLKGGADRITRIVSDAKGYKSSDIPEIRALGNHVASKAIKLQAKWMPLFRKNAAKVLGQNLWREDIKVRAFGNGYKTLEFIGGLFVANANIEDFHTPLHTTFSSFGFTRVQYRWYEGSEYTYYTLK